MKGARAAVPAGCSCSESSAKFGRSDAFGRYFLARDQLDVDRLIPELAVDAQAEPELVGVVINDSSFVDCDVPPFIFAEQLLSHRLESSLFRLKEIVALGRIIKW